MSYPVPGQRRRTIDIAFTRHRLAVLVDGCFWHGCPEHGTSPRQNSAVVADEARRERRPVTATPTSSWQARDGVCCGRGSTKTLRRSLTRSNDSSERPDSEERDLVRLAISRLALGYDLLEDVVRAVGSILHDGLEDPAAGPVA